MVSEIGQIAQFLRATAPFATLEADEIARLSRTIEVRYARAQDRVLEAGSTNRHLFLIRSGAVELLLAGEDLTARLGEGSCFAYPSLLRGGEVRNTTIALEDTLLYCIPADAFHRLRENVPTWRDFFLADETERLRRALDARSATKANPVGERTLGELVARAEPVSCAPETSILDAVKLMRDHDVSTLAICQDGRLLGIFTDKDLRKRVVAEGHPLDAPISSAMTPEPRTLSARATMAEAIALMASGGFRHIPLIDGEGQLSAILSATDILAHLGNNAIDHGLAIARAGDADALIEAARRIPEGFASMARAGLKPVEIMRFTSALGEACHRRAAQIAEAELGPPPCPYALVVFGSLARQEQLIGSDQDNGLVLSDEATVGDKAYFAQLGARISDLLDASGFVYCAGGIMAKNPEQRLTLNEWQSRFAGWINRPTEDAILRATIYFDMAHVHGAEALVDALRDDVLQQAKANSIFASYLARDAQRSTIPLGVFKNFVLDKSAQGERTFNAKAQAVIPIIDIARTMAIAHGVAATKTTERLTALAEANALARDDAGSLIDALDFVNTLRIEHQARQVSEGEQPDHAIAPAHLSALEREHLKDVFTIIRRQLDSLKRNFAGGIS